MPSGLNLGNFGRAVKFSLKGVDFMDRIIIPTLFGLISACVLANSAEAQTRTCQSEIARLQNLIDQAKAGGAPVTDMKEGTFATMHRQPTAATLLAADKDAMARATAALDKARKFEAQHNEAACLKAMDDVAF